MPIAAGDDYFVEVWSATATTGHAYLVNENTSQYVNLTFSAPAGVSLIGNSAEWVIERPMVGAIIPPLTAFGAEPFWEAEAVAFAGTLIDPGSASSVAVDMYTVPPPPSTLLAYPVLMGPTAFVVWYN